MDCWFPDLFINIFLSNNWFVNKRKGWNVRSDPQLQKQVATKRVQRVTLDPVETNETCGLLSSQAEVAEGKIITIKTENSPWTVNSIKDIFSFTIVYKDNAIFNS